MSSTNKPKVSLDGEDERLPLQAIDNNSDSNQLSLSSHITKPSSQQLDTSSQSNDVNIDNSEQPPLLTQQLDISSPEYTIYDMVEELQLPEQGTIKHSTWKDMIGFATKKKSELDPLELLMQPELHRIH